MTFSRRRLKPGPMLLGLTLVLISAIVAVWRVSSANFDVEDFLRRTGSVRIAPDVLQWFSEQGVGLSVSAYPVSEEDEV